ncbi:TATA element modulatory factor-like [Dermacentor andersoni]|uniref:TATA element modulatory factor-like n=1 Tax=Dermacentor andersoni TaxID=34620 RepID=UPI0021551291|nr:TATA element modulatory factor-like [Dermacentor andersoni]
MSWFDTVGIANLAKSALNSAQKRIDRALDIQPDEASGFSLPNDTDSFFLSFGLADDLSKSEQPTSKQPAPSHRDPRPDSRRDVADTESKLVSGWESFLEATSSAVAKPFTEASAVLLQPTRTVSTGDIAVPPNMSPDTAAAVASGGRESPLNIDLPAYPPLEQSAESDGSTETLLGSSSLPGSSSPLSQSRESFLDWQGLTAKELKDSGVIVREPEHVASSGYPAVSSVAGTSIPSAEGSLTSNQVSCISTAASQLSSKDELSIDPKDSGILGSPKAELSDSFVGQQCDSPQHSSQIMQPHESETGPDGFLPQDLWVAVDVPQGTTDKKADRAETHGACGDVVVASVIVEAAGEVATLPEAKQMAAEFGDQADGDAGDTSAVKADASTTATLKEECETQSVAGSAHSAETSSSASFVRISTEETEDSRKSSSPSGDEEGETVSSSDIEIISSVNGGSSIDQFSAVSPARHLWTIQSDSHDEKHFEGAEAAGISEDPLGLPLGGATTESLEDMSEVEGLRARLNKLQSVLDARERKVFLLSKEMAEMADSNAALQSALQKSEQQRVKDNQDTSRLTQEFTHRLARLETKLLDTARERDSLKAKLEAVQQEAVSKVSISQMDVLLKEKDEQIAELMSEGEKLSKQHLQQSTIIKKLRAKEKEMENLIKTHKERLEEQSKELDRLRRSLSAKDEQEKKHIDTIRHLTSSTQKLEREATALQESLNESTINLKDAMSNLDTAYSEIAQLQHANAEFERQAKEASLSAKMAAGEEIRRAMDQARSEALSEKSSLLQRIEELQLALAMADQRSERREEHLHASIRELQQQLQEAEARNQEITQNLSSATRPLLRQIENLQSTFSVQSASWERVERSLTDRLNESQTHATLLAERERALSDKCTDLQQRLMTLEAQNVALRREKQELASECDTLREQQSSLEEYERRESNLRATKARLEQSLKTLRTEKDALSAQLSALQEELSSEHNKNALLQEQLRAEREKRLENSNTPSPTASHYSSVSDTFNCNPLPDDLSMANSTFSVGPASRHTSLYESLRGVGGSSLIESLQAQLKMREGEVGQLQAQIGQLERCRESLSRELTLLSAKQELWDQEHEELRELRVRFEDVNQKYNTLLQMYGEKVEEAEELRLDLEDIKSMYKAQINELINAK